MTASFFPGRPPVTDLTRRAGSLHLAVGGLVNVTVAVVLSGLLVSGRLVGLLVATLPTVVDEVALVANTPLILTFVAWGAPMASVALALVGVAQLYSSWHSYHARRWTWGVVSGLLGAVNPVTFPVGIVAAVLLFLSKTQFTDPHSGQRE